MMKGMARELKCGGKPVTVIVLAGGRSRRMNADKARLRVGDGTLLDHVLAQVRPHFEEVLVSISPGQTTTLEAQAETGKQNQRHRNNRSTSKDAHRKTQVRIVEDGRPGQGPMAGLLACLIAADNEVCFVVACDIPDVNVPLVRSLVRALREAEIAVPMTPAGQFEPLHAVYKKSIIPEIERLLRAGERSLLPLFEKCRTVAVPLADTSWLRNLNTRTDYRNYLKDAASERDRKSKGPRLLRKP